MYKKVTGRWVGDFKQQMKSGTIKIVLSSSFCLRVSACALPLRHSVFPSFSEVPYITGCSPGNLNGSLFNLTSESIPRFPPLVKGLRGIFDEKESSLLVLKIITSNDREGYKNSVITSWKITEKRLNNYVRNKDGIYKKE